MGPQIPSHVIEPKHNNPVWNIPAIVPVERMDNSLAMTEQVAVLRDQKGKEIGDITKPIGGVVFIVNIHDEKESFGSRRYAIKCHDLCLMVASMDAALRVVPKTLSPATIKAMKKKRR
jgi:hypothetical protein